MKHTPILVLVDLQPYFINKLPEKKRKTLVNGVKRAVEIFKERKLPILILEYDLNDLWIKSMEACAKTDPSIMKCIDKYKKVHTKHKRTDSGHKEVKAYLKDRKYKGAHLFLCGVNADACVRRTFVDLVDSVDGNHIPTRIVTEITMNCWRPYVNAKKSDLPSMDKNALISSRSLVKTVEANKPVCNTFKCENDLSDGWGG